MFCAHNLTSLLPKSKKPSFPQSFGSCKAIKKQTPEALKTKGSEVIVVIPTSLSHSISFKKLQYTRA